MIEITTQQPETRGTPTPPGGDAFLVADADRNADKVEKARELFDGLDPESLTREDGKDFLKAVADLDAGERKDLFQGIADEASGSELAAAFDLLETGVARWSVGPLEFGGKTDFGVPEEATGEFLESMFDRASLDAYSEFVSILGERARDDEDQARTLAQLVVASGGYESGREEKLVGHAMESLDSKERQAMIEGATIRATEAEPVGGGVDWKDEKVLDTDLLNALVGTMAHMEHPDSEVEGLDLKVDAFNEILATLDADRRWAGGDGREAIASSLATINEMFRAEGPDLFHHMDQAELGDPLESMFKLALDNKSPEAIGVTLATLRQPMDEYVTDVHEAALEADGTTSDRLEELKDELYETGQGDAGRALHALNHAAKTATEVIDDEVGEDQYAAVSWWTIRGASTFSLGGEVSALAGRGILPPSWGKVADVATPLLTDLFLEISRDMRQADQEAFESGTIGSWATDAILPRTSASPEFDESNTQKFRNADGEVVYEAPNGELIQKSVLPEGHRGEQADGQDKSPAYEIFDHIRNQLMSSLPK